MINQAKAKTDILTFLALADKIPVIDVRSPSEYRTGHIPGSFNIPLFNDMERETVGIRYKKEGRIKALLAGLELTGPSMHSKLEQAIKISKESKLLVHCWRGGIRSEAMAWLFSLGSIETYILEGGYKSYRHFVLENLSLNKGMIIIIGGLTGSGKTQILKHLQNTGKQVIDLEGLANHKGSAFGSLGQPSQPSSEHFANLLFDKWKQVDQHQPVWIEDESRNIGTVFMPEKFYLNMQKNPAIILLMDAKTRLPRLLQEYSCYPLDQLVASVNRISKRLGGDKTKEAIEAINSGDLAKAIEITLQYYDKGYMFGLRKKQGKDIYYINTDTDDIEVNAQKILDVASKLFK